MGIVHSNGNCLAVKKQSRHSMRRHRTSRSVETIDVPDQEEEDVQEVVVLSEQDFRGCNLNALCQRQPHITEVRFAVGEKLDEGQEWIPTDSDLIQLTRLQSLESLDATECKEITRRGLTRFCLTPAKIKTLILNDCPRITNNFFDHIVHFCRLERLQLRGCFRISDNGVEALRSLRHLHHLDISVCATEQVMSFNSECECPTITDAALHTLSRMTQLQTLEMEQCSRITDEGLLRLVTLRNLTCLNLSQTGLTDRGLKVLRNFPELDSLHIGGCQISESALLQELVHATRLEHLDISASACVSDTFTQGLAKNHSLTHLNVSKCEKLTDKSFHHLNTITSLTHLNANSCPGLTGKCLCALTQLSGLQALHLSDVMDLDIHDVLPFRDLRDLEISAPSAEDERLSSLESNEDGPSLCVKVLGIHVQLM